jgi:uncharacterized membrane protein YciS (DUF1049 family)
MFRKIAATLILVPLAVVIVALAVANRQMVTISFDPFSTTDPAFALRLPLFALVFVVLLAGVLIGGIAAWLKQSKWRRNARRLDAQLKRAETELAAIKGRSGEGPDLPMIHRAPPIALRPPAA